MMSHSLTLSTSTATHTTGRRKWMVFLMMLPLAAFTYQSSLIGISEEASNSFRRRLMSPREDYLLGLFNDITPLTTESFQPVPYAYRRKSKVPYDAITLTTQLSLNKFDRLASLVDRWNGPVSCAVYLPNEEAILQLGLVVEQQSQKFHDLVTVHLLLEKEPLKSDYPVNMLRNLALFNIETEYFLLSDVDFMTSQNAHDYLIDFFRRQQDRSKIHSTLYVLPAFDVFGKKKDLNTMLTDVKEVPQTKDKLLDTISKKEAETFHEYWAPGHRATNFDKWYQCNSNNGTDPSAELYPINYEFMFEPYVVGTIHAVHRFDERYRGFGMNKVTWVKEADLRGYEFQVLCDVFVAHMYHPGRKEREPSPDTKIVTEWYQDHYWPSKYHTTKGLRYTGRA